MGLRIYVIATRQISESTTKRQSDSLKIQILLTIGERLIMAINLKTSENQRFKQNPSKPLILRIMRMSNPITRE